MNLKRKKKKKRINNVIIVFLSIDYVDYFLFSVLVKTLTDCFFFFFFKINKKEYKKKNKKKNKQCYHCFFYRSTLSTNFYFPFYFLKK